MSAILFVKINILVALAAVLMDRFVGYPEWLYSIIRHPVVWVGALIRLCDSRMNRENLASGSKTLLGLITLVIILAFVLAATVPLTVWLRSQSWGFLVEAILAAGLISQKSLLRHVEAVAAGLKQSLQEGRKAVSHIVGRDPDLLDEAGVARGAIESLAENSSDGVIAPIFWLLVAGLPGIAIYKAVNTADSMIGHKSEKYRNFGTASARLDDLLNLPASRLAGLLFAGARTLSDLSGAVTAWKTMVRDAGKHVSPNAGWPEAAAAGALDIRLGGPRKYGGREVKLPWLGTGKINIDASDIHRALDLAVVMFNLVAVLLGLALLAVYLLN